MDKIEMLSRMWIECDPNRQPSRADEPFAMSTPDGRVMVPYWRWFEARAKASVDYFEKHGFELVPVGGVNSDTLGDAECDRQERDAHLLWDGATAMVGAQIGGEAAKGQMPTREVKRQRDLQLLAEAYQIANERGQVVLASSIAHLFGELHLDTAA